MAVGLAVVGARVEDAVLVLALLALWKRVGARPLDRPERAELLVGHGRVVARAAATALAPAVECALGIGPLHERRAVTVAEVHPGPVVDEHVQVGAGLARRL